MIPQPHPAWMDSDLEMLADTANKFFDKECLPNDARWRAQRHADREPVDQGRRGRPAVRQHPRGLWRRRRRFPP